MSLREHKDTVAAAQAVQVREAVEQDAADIGRIYNYYVDAGGATFDTAHWSEGHVREILDCQPQECWLVGVDSGVIVGWASARRYSLRYGYRFCCETAIYLMPSALGRGIGDALQQQLEQHCRQCGIHHAVARIIADNQRSMAFHRRHGYQLVGVQQEIGHMGGRWVDVAILQKIL